MSRNLNDVITNICKQKIESKKISKQPLCILLGGLPGAGKTNLVEQIQKEYKERDFVVIDTDDYRKLHPDYDILLKTPEKAISETSNFSNAIESELIKKAIEKKCDIISVTTLRATDAINNILYEPAIKSGYKMEACIMSVPISESGLSAQYRYEKQIKDGECPRFTPMSFIEGSHQGIMNTIKMLQTKKDKPKIRVFKRGKDSKSMPIELYNSSKSQGNRYSCALEAFMNPTKLLDKQTAIKTIKELYNLKQCRNANNIEYSSLERLEELFGIEKANER
ncbi:MAG: zeta toxin family protein [Clostridia bacterium]|nr:zeta toxin family protein [Clostridia bacterium]